VGRLQQLSTLRRRKALAFSSQGFSTGGCFAGGPIRESGDQGSREVSAFPGPYPGSPRRGSEPPVAVGGGTRGSRNPVEPVDVAPVKSCAGAIRRVPGACPMDCPDTCNWVVTVDDGRAVRLEARLPGRAPRGAGARRGAPSPRLRETVTASRSCRPSWPGITEGSASAEYV
jgi:hypothetical protein